MGSPPARRRGRARSVHLSVRGEVLITGETDALPGFDPGRGYHLLDLCTLATYHALTCTTPPVATHWWPADPDPKATWAADDDHSEFGRPQNARSVGDRPRRRGMDLPDHQPHDPGGHDRRQGAPGRRRKLSR